VDDDLKKAAVACLQILNNSANPGRLSTEELQAIIDRLNAATPLSVDEAAGELGHRRKEEQ
jgi:hypothetical protein